MLLYSHILNRSGISPYSAAGAVSYVVLPLDGHCIIQPLSNPPQDSTTNYKSVPSDSFHSTMISLLYKVDEGSKVRLLDVDCEANPGSTEKEFHD